MRRPRFFSIILPSMILQILSPFRTREHLLGKGSGTNGQPRWKTLLGETYI